MHLDVARNSIPYIHVGVRRAASIGHIHAAPRRHNIQMSIHDDFKWSISSFWDLQTNLSLLSILCTLYDMLQYTWIICLSPAVGNCKRAGRTPGRDGGHVGRGDAPKGAQCRSSNDRVPMRTARQGVRLSLRYTYNTGIPNKTVGSSLTLFLSILDRFAWSPSLPCTYRILVGFTSPPPRSLVNLSQ